MTKQKSIEKRLKQLQTANQEELYVRDSFKTDFPYKIERLLHQKYAFKRLLNEWFELDEEDVKNFQNDCDIYEKVALASSKTTFKQIDYQF